MAKMFYTTEEVAEKLGKSVDEVREMARKGQIQEFRDRDKVMFKVDQIDLIAGDDTEPSIPLALDDSEQSFAPLTSPESEPASEPLDLSGTGIPALDASASGSAIGLADSVGSSAPAAPVGARSETSSLLDLTRESEETSLGAELLEDIYSSEDNVEIPGASSGLFDAAGDDGGEAPAMIGGRGDDALQPFAPVLAAASVEQVDPGWSGLAAGLMVGTLLGVLALGLVAIVVLGGGASPLAGSFAANLYAWAGGLLGITLVSGIAGFFIGRAVG